MAPEYRHHSSAGSLTIPPPGTTSNGTAGPAAAAATAASAAPPAPPPVGAMGRFEGPRSPPGRQNTSHVPCKFFRQGACQAGTACPFSHDLASQGDHICKYFAKGNCKFGPKCANVHVLPDGRRVNYKPGGLGGGHLNIGNRLHTDGYHHHPPPTSTLSSFIRNAAPSPYGPPYPVAYPSPDDGRGRQQSIDIHLPILDPSGVARPRSTYGSPRDDDPGRLGLGLGRSPPVAAKGLSVLDAQLPASFDSNGVSWIARNGPMAASVPAKFGLESPPGSPGAAKDGPSSDALRSLHSSAFGDDARDRLPGPPASPPPYPTEEYFGKKPMHSQRYPKPRLLSSSVPKPDYDWESNFQFEEDLLPEALNDLMTPQEKARRGSRTAAEEGRPITSGAGTPHPEGRFGSPLGASPSRWGPLFSRQQKEEEDRARGSAFGHVGSPLRPASLHPAASPGARPLARHSVSGDASPYLASPPRQSSMSIISQQLQRTRLARAESHGSELPPRPSSALSGARAVAERQVSASSIGGSGRLTTPIDEEHGDFMFNLEEDLDEKKRYTRSSGGWTIASGTHPTLGALGGRHGSASSPSGGADGVFGAR